jgi:malate dehydrogenase (quinone)
MKTYDVIIIGGGITGAATLYALTRYTGVKKVALIEKYRQLAEVNTNKDNNSQTLHFGDIETNYTAERAKSVSAKTEMTRKYLEAHKNERLFTKNHKMVIGVGAKEVQFLEQRYKEIKHIFPKLQKLNRAQIAKLEPKVIEGRDPKQQIIALMSPDGYVVDFGRLADSYEHHSGKHDIYLGLKVWSLYRDGEWWIAKKGTEGIRAKAVVVAAGTDSLLFAHKCGYLKHWIILPVAGSFYTAPRMLSGKVYTIQAKKLPFAAVHGDPDVSNPQETRFGPTAKVLPMMERYHYGSVLDFMRIFRFRADATLSLINIIRDPVLFKYILNNVIYDIPYVGTYYFMKQNVTKIVPTIKFSEIKFGRHLGGIRPQLVDTRKKSLEFGDAKGFGDNIIFDITPSPGASVALWNGVENAKKTAEFLKIPFNTAKFEKELGTKTVKKVINSNPMIS